MVCVISFGRAAAGSALTAKRTSVDSIVTLSRMAVDRGNNATAAPAWGGDSAER